MHLLVRDTRSLDEAAPAVDLGHGVADLVVLSFSDADLGALAAADSGASLRLAPLGKLRHPLSVDLYLEQTVAHARCVVARLLGGVDYWRYGVEELSALCRARSIPLAVLPGDGRDDPALAALSTVSAAHYHRLDACFRHGGRRNMAAALALMAHLAGLASDDGALAEELPQHGVHSLDLDTRPLAAVIFYRSHLLSEDFAPIAALLAALRNRGLAAGALFVGSLKAADTAAFVAKALRSWAPAIVLNATAFSARPPSPASLLPLPTGEGRGEGPTAPDRSPLDSPNAPILQLILASTSQSAWQASTRGLTPADLAMQVVLPELDGRLLTTAISFKSEQNGRTIHVPDPDGIALAADRAAAWAKLRATPASDREIAIVLSDYPAAAGQRGHAVGLDGFASLAAITRLLTDANYTTRPAAQAELTQALSHAEPTPFLSLAEYTALFATLPAPLQAAAIAAWGEPSAPGGHFTLRHVRLGNLTLCLQPGRGDLADRRAGYHDPDLPPCHAYIAFYLSLRRCHAMVHLGTHGSLEWLPGKAAALSAQCWPRALIGGLPVIYPFIVNNPGEAAAAKRRLGAVTIGHLTPPIRPAALHGDAAGLERMIDEYAAADGMDRRRTTLLRAQILDRAAAAGLARRKRRSRPTHGRRRRARPARRLSVRRERTCKSATACTSTAPNQTPARLAMLPPGASDCAAAERHALLAALDGRFVPPGPAGAPSVRPHRRAAHRPQPRRRRSAHAADAIGLTLAEKAATDMLAPPPPGPRRLAARGGAERVGHLGHAHRRRGHRPGPAAAGCAAGLGRRIGARKRVHRHAPGRAGPPAGGRDLAHIRPVPRRLRRPSNAV